MPISSLESSMWRWLGGSAWGIAVVGAGALWAEPARACGGCFHPVIEVEPSVVSGHRMVFAVSATRTVLWDEFSYTGAPQDFSWVLPVKPGAYIEASEQAWFDALEAVTGTRVQQPNITCPNSGNSGCACGGASLSADKASGGGYYGDTVTVVHQGTVGPYDTVTLRSTDPNALRTWLVTNGYEIPPSIDPIISAYVSEGFDFIGLRLSPGQGIAQMDPVRVITPGGGFTLPLRMVAAGVGDSVPIVLYVVGEGRFALTDLAETRVDPHDVTWDFNTQSSNYQALRAAALAQNDGRSYLTSFALAKPFTATSSDQFGQTVQFSSRSGAFAATLAELYFDESTYDASGSITPPPCGGALSVLDSAAPIVDTCDPANPTVCGPIPAGSIAASDLACGQASDIATALVGMHPSNAWITRLELDLPLDALDRDCIVDRATTQTSVSNTIVAGGVKNPPCPEPIFASNSLPRRGPWRDPPVVFSACLAGIWFLRRRTSKA